jgi:hypothetical protein
MPRHIKPLTTLLFLVLFLWLSGMFGMWVAQRHNETESVGWSPLYLSRVSQALMPLKTPEAKAAELTVGNTACGPCLTVDRPCETVNTPTCDTTCPVTCAPTCASTCPATCANTCPATCANTCPATCANTCPATCDTSCGGTCEASCAATCDCAQPTTDCETTSTCDCPQPTTDCETTSTCDCPLPTTDCDTTSTCDCPQPTTDCESMDDCSTSDCTCSNCDTLFCTCNCAHATVDETCNCHTSDCTCGCSTEDCTCRCNPSTVGATCVCDTMDLICNPDPSIITSESGVDFGDAPDDAAKPNDYATLWESYGAWHRIIAGYYLGAGVDRDDRARPSETAAGDDMLDGNDDEDGIRFKVPLKRGRQVEIEVVASMQGFLEAWIDFNADRDWHDSGEHVVQSFPLTKGKNTVSLTIPNYASIGVTFARFRFSSWSGLLPYGGAPDGEVEDYRVVIR